MGPGESLERRRREELERACAVLGVSRLVVLPFHDSGAHDGPFLPGTFGATEVGDAARLVAEVVWQEGADTLVHYDPRGIYGHVDHVQVHRVGTAVVRRLGIAGYQATMDAEALRRGPFHVVQEAAGDDRPVGVPSGEVSLTLRAERHELLAKMAAMAVHGSQIGPRWLDARTFAAGYGTEWYLRTRQETGALDTGATAGALDRVACGLL